MGDINDMARPADQALAVPVEPASSLAAARFDPSRDLFILYDALQEIADWYSPEGMGTANTLAAIAADALEEFDALRDSDRNPEGEDRNGLRAEPESAGRQASPNPEQESQQ